MTNTPSVQKTEEQDLASAWPDIFIGFSLAYGFLHDTDNVESSAEDKRKAMALIEEAFTKARKIGPSMPVTASRDRLAVLANRARWILKSLFEKSFNKHNHYSPRFSIFATGQEILDVKNYIHEVEQLTESGATNA